MAIYRGMSPKDYDDFDFYSPIEARVEAEILDDEARAEMFTVLARLLAEA